MSQGTLFDMEESRARKDRALQHVADGTPPGWLQKARAFVLAVAVQKPEFTSDDVWQAGLADPPEPRALGAVMGDLARLGLIEKTGQYVKTARKTRHAAPIAVWRRRQK